MNALRQTILGIILGALAGSASLRAVDRSVTSTFDESLAPLDLRLFTPRVTFAFTQPRSPLAVEIERLGAQRGPPYLSMPPIIEDSWAMRWRFQSIIGGEVSRAIDPVVFMEKRSHEPVDDPVAPSPAAMARAYVAAVVREITLPQTATWQKIPDNIADLIESARHPQNHPQFVPEPLPLQVPPSPTL